MYNVFFSVQDYNITTSLVDKKKIKISLFFLFYMHSQWILEWDIHTYTHLYSAQTHNIDSLILMIILSVYFGKQKKNVDPERITVTDHHHHHQFIVIVMMTVLNILYVHTQTQMNMQRQCAYGFHGIFFWISFSL